MDEKRSIGSLGEKSLHAALKGWLAQPGDQLETPVDGYVIDLVRGEQLIEIQTRAFSAIKPKLTALLENHPVRLMHPIAQERFVVRVDADGVVVSRRKSPRRGTIYHLFTELVRIPQLVTHPNFSLEVLLIREEQIWLDDARGSWRRKGWSIHDRRLLDVIESIVLATPADFAALLPATLPEPFTTKELAAAIKQPPALAQKMAYCLREMNVIIISGKRGRALVYEISDRLRS